MPKGKDTLAVKFYLEPEQGEALKRLAAASDRSLSAELRRAVRSHLDRSLAGPDKRDENEPGNGAGPAAKRIPAVVQTPVRPPGPASETPKVDLPPPPARDLAARTPGVTLGSEVPPPRQTRRITEGAAKGMCIHRRPLDSVCIKCERGEAA